MEKIRNALETILSKEGLKQMEVSGNYVFHGSPSVITSFEPRQAYTEVNGESVMDGKPAIFASSEIETPIFRSIFHESNFNGLQGSFKIGFSNKEEEKSFIEANQAAINVSQNNKGYVYVFEKKYFHLRGNNEWISEQNIRPCAIFYSSFKDIGLSIKKLDD